MSGQGHILEGEGVGVGPFPPAVLEPARLGTQPPVAGAPADDGGEETLAGVTHTQGSVGEGLNLNGRVETNVLNGVPAEFPGEDHPGHAQLRAAADAVQAVDGQLCGPVDGKAGSHLAEHPQDPQVLDEHRVHPRLGGLGGRPGCGGELPVGNQGVQGEKYLGAPHMAVRNRRRKLLQGEVLRIAAGVKVPVSQIDRVGAGLDRRGDGLRRTSGCEKFQHDRRPPA